MRKVLWSSPDNVISVVHSPEGEFDGKNTHYNHLYIDGNVNKSAEEIISLSSTHLDKLGKDYLDMAKKFLALSEEAAAKAYYDARNFIMESIEQHHLGRVSDTFSHVKVSVECHAKDANTIHASYSLVTDYGRFPLKVGSVRDFDYKTEGTDADAQEVELFDQVTKMISENADHIKSCYRLISSTYPAIDRYFTCPNLYNELEQVNETLRKAYMNHVSQLQSFLRPGTDVMTCYMEAVDKFKASIQPGLEKWQELTNKINETLKAAGK